MHNKTGKEITTTKRDEAIAKIAFITRNKYIDWPDFYNEAIELKGIPAGRIIAGEREERF